MRSESHFDLLQPSARVNEIDSTGIATIDFGCGDQVGAAPGEDDLRSGTDFEKKASAHVRILISKLVMEHRKVMSSLQSEVLTLKGQLSNAKEQNNQADAGVSAQPDNLAGSTTESFTSQLAPHATPESNTATCTDAVDDASGARNYCQLAPVAPPESNTATCADAVDDIPAVSRSWSYKRRSRVSSWLRPKSSLSWEGLAHEGERNKSAADLHKMKTIGKDDLGKGEVRVTLVQRFVNSNTFEMITGGIIVLNTIVMTVQLQYVGFELGYLLNRDKYSRPATEVWPGADTKFFVLDLIFNTLFSAELLLRMYTYGLKSFRMGWMWFDTIIVALGLMDTFAGDVIGIDPTMIRLVRLVRLGRIVKLFKAMNAVDSLFLLLKAIRASISALCWSFLLLMIVELATGLFLCQVLHGFMVDEEIDMESRRKVFGYFGTLDKALVTMAEITLANWVPSCRVLMEEVHEAFLLFYIVYRCMFCFAVIKVIAAVFITETNRVLASDSELNMLKGQREALASHKKLSALFSVIDLDKSREVDWPEMQKFLADAEQLKWLNTIGLSRVDFEKLFWLVEVDGKIHIDKFVSMVKQLHGTAKTVDLLNLFKVVHRMDARLQELTGVKEDLEGRELYRLANSGPEDQDEE